MKFNYEEKKLPSTQLPESDEAIDSVSSFLKIIKGLKDQTHIGDQFFYRGQNEYNFGLLPSILRFKGKDIPNEPIVTRELMLNHPEEFAHDKSMLQILARMQHYSMPTRLLDLTMNPLVGLYFSCIDHYGKCNHAKDGSVFLIAMRSYSIKYYDSDTVSMLANLSLLDRDCYEELQDIALSEIDKKSIRDTKPLKAKMKLYLEEKEKIKDKLASLPAATSLLHLIRAEKAYFSNDMNPSDLRSVFLVKSKMNNSRLIAQSGAFLIFGLLHQPLKNKTNGITYQKYKVHKDAKPDILEELEIMNINERTVFPLMEKTAQYLKKQYRLGMR